MYDIVRECTIWSTGPVISTNEVDPLFHFWSTYSFGSQRWLKRLSIRNVHHSKWILNAEAVEGIYCEMESPANDLALANISISVALKYTVEKWGHLKPQQLTHAVGVFCLSAVFRLLTSDCEWSVCLLVFLHREKCFFFLDEHLTLLFYILDMKKKVKLHYPGNTATGQNYQYQSPGDTTWHLWFPFKLFDVFKNKSDIIHL